MKGRVVLVGLGVALMLFAAALWWFQTRAFYEDIAGVEAIEVAGREIPVGAFRGITAASSPIKLRACMMLDPAELAGAPLAARPTPLIAPGWFDCFDAGELTAALRAGEARAYVAATGEFADTERLVAVFPDGRAYMWRQLTEGAR